jgi:hypothetical protein
MPTRNVDLTDYHDEFVNQLIASGRFSNVPARPDNPVRYLATLVNTR